MDILSNLNKNIFGENHKHDSNSIDFSAQPKPVKSHKMFEAKSDKPTEANNINDKPKPLSSNNLTEIKQEKSKTTNSSKDNVSYIYNKSALKNISDPLSQMRPDSNFGYPTQKKNKKEKPKETKESKEEKKEEKKEEINN